MLDISRDMLLAKYAFSHCTISLEYSIYILTAYFLVSLPLRKIPQ